MRLSFEISGEVSGATLRVRLGSTTVTDEHTLPWDAAHVTALAGKIVDVLRRGNRARSLAESALSELRFLGEELYRALIPPGLDAQLRRGQGPLLLDLDEALVPVPFELVFDGEQYLCRRYALGRMVRSRVLPPLPRDPFSSGAAAPGTLPDAAARRGRPRLPRTVPAARSGGVFSESAN